MAPLTPRTSQGESGSFTGCPLGSTVFDECTFYPGTTTGTREACIQLGVLSSVFALLPAHLKMELIKFIVFSIFTTIFSPLSLSHAIFSTNSTPAFPFSLPVCVYVSLSKMQHHCGLENCSRKRMRRKSFHVDMSSPNRIAASADGLEWLQCILFCLIILQLCFAFLI